jgi:hypothetical protein
MAVRKKGSARPGKRPAPPETLRRNRVVAMLTDEELVKLMRVAEAKSLPVGTLARQLIVTSLAKR